MSFRFDNSAAAEGSAVADDGGDGVVDAFRRLLLRLPSQRPQKGRQALRDVTGDEGWAGADDDYDRAVSFSPAAFTWKRALRNLVELPALWSSIPLLGRDPHDLARQARAILIEHGAALPPFVVVDDKALTLVWAIEPLRRPKEGKPAFHFQCFFEQLQYWRWAAIKLSYAFEPLGARPLDVAAADEALLGFVPLPPHPGSGLFRHAAELGLSPARIVDGDGDGDGDGVVVDPVARIGAPARGGEPPVRTPVRIAAVSKPLRRFNERLFVALGRAPLSGARRRWRDTDVSQTARAPQPAGARHPAALKLVCANRWDGLSREANLADVRAWAELCEDDGAFPARARAAGAAVVDELEALVDWAEQTLVPGGPTPRGDAPERPRPRRRTSRDHVAAAVCGFLADADGAFEGSLAELGQRAALWALDHGAHQPVPLRTLKRAVVDLVGLGELAHDVVRVGATWRSSFALRSSTSTASLVSREKILLAAKASIAAAQGQQGQSMWAPAPALSSPVPTPVLTIRGGSGGAFPLSGGSRGETEANPSPAGFADVVETTSPPERSEPLGGVVETTSPPEPSEPLGGVVETTSPPEPSEPLGGVVAATSPPVSLSSFVEGGGAIVETTSSDETGASRGPGASPRQRRLPLPRGRRTFVPPSSSRVPGEGLPPLDATVEAALADVGRHLSGADHRALLEEARAGLFARPRVLADFVGALRRRALRILRLREIASASAAHLQARRHAEARAAAQRAEALPSPIDDRAADEVFADFRRLLAAQVKPLHERTAIERARRLYEDGLSLLPLPARSKKPATSWKQQQHERLTLRRLEHDLAALGPDAGLAVVCGEVSGVVVADFDDADAVAWAREHLPDTPWKTRTARGEHWYYRLPFDPARAVFTPPSSLPWKGELRAAGHYVVAPGSWHPDGARYVALGDWSVPRDALPTWSSAFVSSSSASSSVPGEVERLRAARARILKGDR